MLVLTAAAMGLCFGVKDALALARAVDHPTQVTVFGQLVHNPAVTDDLEARGFALADETARDPAALARPAVLITAHGLSDRDRAALAAAGKTVIDATCPLVRRAHAAAVALARAGCFVVVAGRRGHVEIRGLTGDLAPGRFAVVERPDEVTPYAADQIGVVAQTTAVEEEVAAVVARVKEQNPAARVRFVNTVCRPTRDRQTALDDLLTQVDVLVAVGGRQSNNTRQLADRARRAGVRALHVESAADLDASQFAPTDVVGLTAGTSTLPETIAAVQAKLESFHPRFTAVSRPAPQGLAPWRGRAPMSSEHTVRN
jgi:4-hydroxy-3-methylbut-2-enyl diphosphate reductase